MKRERDREDENMKRRVGGGGGELITPFTLLYSTDNRYAFLLLAYKSSPWFSTNGNQEIYQIVINQNQLNRVDYELYG